LNVGFGPDAVVGPESDVPKSELNLADVSGAWTPPLCVTTGVGPATVGGPVVTPGDTALGPTAVGLSEPPLHAARIRAVQANAAAETACRADVTATR
jgi:hypothetical protein